MALRPGTNVGPYRIDAPIGAGGMPADRNPPRESPPRPSAEAAQWEERGRDTLPRKGGNPKLPARLIVGVGMGEDSLGLWKAPRTFDSRPVCEAIAAVRSTRLRPAADAFALNVQHTVDLLLLPVKLALSGARLEQERVSLLVRERMAARDSVDATIKRSWQMLSNLVLDDPTRASCSALLGASASYAWAAYESAAKDAWTAALDHAPGSLAEGVLRARAAAGDSTGLKFTLLQKYRYDVSHSMGTILAREMDFTSASGIAKAYGRAFGAGLTIKQILERPELVVLEATRHVIVHRGGAVDGEYNRRTGQALPEGAPLQLHVDTIAPWINSAFDTGARLLQFVDDWSDGG